MPLVNIPQEWSYQKAAEYACRVKHFPQRPFQKFISFPQAAALLPFSTTLFLQLLREDKHFLGLVFIDDWIYVHPDEVYYLATQDIRKKLGKELKQVRQTILLLHQSRLQEEQKS